MEANSGMKVSKRGSVPPFYVMEVMKAAAEREAAGKEVLHLEVGQPSTQAPSGVLKAAAEALQNERLGYTNALGIPELRNRIARHYRDYYGVRIPAERIAITTGSSGAFLLSFLASMDAGDRIALAEPGYPAYRNILTSLDIEAVGIPTGPETRFQPTPELLDRVEGEAGRTSGGDTSQPDGDHAGYRCDERTGRILRPAEHASHRRRDLSRDHLSRAGSDRSIAFRPGHHHQQLSKYFSMTGWRLGWMVVPEDLHRAVECLAQNHFISPPAHSQAAALAAFDCMDEAEENVERYRRNREILLRELPKPGSINWRLRMVRSSMRTCRS